MKLITRDLLRHVTEQAATSPRLRMNHNIHSCNDSRCHRLLNAIEPGSYIRPHRHLDPEKDESLVLLSGRLGVITFSNDGTVADAVTLSHLSGVLAADIPHGIFHTALSLEPGTIFFEAKAGPYLQLTEEEKAPWAPGDDDAASSEYLERLARLFR